MKYVTAPLLVILTACAAIAQDRVELLHRWQLEPDLKAEWAYIPPEPVVRLDATQLRGDSQQRITESQKAIRYADVEQLEGKDDFLAVALEILHEEEMSLQVRAAILSAAIALSDGSEAERLWGIVRGEQHEQLLVERALIGWRSPQALEMWRARATDREAMLQPLLVAIDGIGVLGNVQDRILLERLLVADRLPEPAKIVVSRALGALVNQKLEALAQQLLESSLDHRQLIAAQVLRNHTSERAKELLRSIWAGEDNAAQLVAFESLTRIASPETREMARQAVSHRDSPVRLAAVAVINGYSDEAAVREQASGLADRNQLIRRTVRENLRRKANSEDLRTVVDEVISYHLQGPAYEGVEQAILLAVSLGEVERCPDFVRLLEHERVEVNIRAAWALQELANTPEIMEAILMRVAHMTAQLQSPRANQLTRSDTVRGAFLIEALGRNAYEPAAAVLTEYIPKRAQLMRSLTRTSAIWALGKIHEGSQDEELAQQLGERLLDTDSMEPEEDIVRYASAVAMGMIKAPQSRAQLLRSSELPPYPIGLARDWALAQFPASASN